MSHMGMSHVPRINEDGGLNPVSIRVHGGCTDLRERERREGGEAE